MNSSFPAADVSSQTALLLIQLNDFKGLNNRKGYKAGDQALISLSKILTTSTNYLQDRIPCRLNGADFTIYRDVLKAESAEQVAQEICTILQGMHKADKIDITHVPSIGLLIISSSIELSKPQMIGAFPSNQSASSLPKNERFYFMQSGRLHILSIREIGIIGF